MQKTVIVSFANEAGNYRKAMDRLSKSLDDVGYKGDKLFYTNEQDISPACPKHKDVPYAFKAYALMEAWFRGYDNIIWMDSAVYAVKPIDDFIKHIEFHRYIFFDNVGYSIADYTNDKCLEHYKYTREEAKKHKMIMACCFGLKRQSIESATFINLYMDACNNGLFNGSWEDHRHDQSVASLIIAGFRMVITNGQSTYFSYVDHLDKMEIADSVCLHSQGL